MKHLISGLFCLMVACAVIADDFKQNLVENSSFELNNAGYAWVKYLDPIKNPKLQYIKAIRNKDGAVHGNFYLTVDNRYNEKSRLCLKEIELESGQKYTMSAWMKSPINGCKVSLELLSVWQDIYTASGRQHWAGRSRNFELNQAWKRYSFSFTAPEKPHRFYTLLIGVESPAQMSIDAIQVNKGELCDYSPGCKVETAITFDRDLIVKKHDSDKLDFRIDTVNYSKEHVVEILETTVHSTNSDHIVTKAVKIDLKSGEHKSYPVEFGNALFGYYQAAATADDKTTRTIAGGAAVVGDYSSRKVDIEKDYCVSFDGDNICYGNKSVGKVFIARNRTLDESYALLKNSGCRLVHLRSGGNDPFPWAMVEPQTGEFNFEYSDIVVKMLDKYDIGIFTTIGEFMEMGKNNPNYFPNLPDWIKQNSKVDNTYLAGFLRGKGRSLFLPPVKAWENYVMTLGKRYAKSVKTYEIMNEPLFYISPAEYMKYLKSSYTVLHGLGLKVIGASLSTDFGSSADSWATDICRLGGLKYCDYISFHPYSSRQLGSINEADKDIENMRKTFAGFGFPDKPLWNTELYFLNDKAHNSYVAGITTPETAATRFLLDLGEGIKQSSCITAGQIYHNTMSPNMRSSSICGQLSPSSVYVAYNALARIFTGAKPVDKIRWGADTICYIYRKGNTYLAAFWKYGKDKEVKVKIDCGLTSLSCYDIFGNVIKTNGEFSLKERPFYMSYNGNNPSEFISRFKKVEIKISEPLRVLGSRMLPGLMSILLSNRSGKELSGFLCVTGQYKSGRVNYKLPANQKKWFTVPVGFDDKTAASSTLMITATGKIWKFPIKNISEPVVYQSIKGGISSEQTFGKDGNFNAGLKISHDDKNLVISLKVKDFSPYAFDAKKHPWTQDCVELFFDAAPLEVKNFKKPELYNDSCGRLFILPHAPVEKQLVCWPGEKLKFSADKISLSSKNSAEGYVIILKIPLELFGKKMPDMIGFDIAIDNADSSTKKRHVLNWNSQGKAHSDRFSFGFIKLINKQ